MKPYTRRNRPSKRPTARRPVGLVESFEPRVLLAIDVTVGVGAPARTLSFTDPDGTAATIRVAGGAATVTFDGTNLASTPAGTAVAVTGTNVVMTNLVITGPNPNVTVNTAGDGTVNLGGLSAAGPVAGFRGPGVVLGGTTTLANGIGRLELGGTQGATINITRGGQARLQDAALTIGTAQDTSINSQQPLSQLRVGSWAAGVPGQPDQITTPRINTIQSAGDFAAGISLSGNGQAVGRPILGNVRVGGALAAGGAWDVDGRASRVAAGSVAPGWSGVFGDVSSFAVANDFAGALTANSINALSAGSITNADITLNRAAGVRASALNRLAVRGAISGTDVRANADIGSVSARSITGSTIYAGVTSPGGALPTSAAAFTSAATIKNVTIGTRGGTTPTFVDSNIAAATLGRIKLGAVQVSNAGEPFGLAAQTVRSLSAVGAAGAPVRESNLTEPADSIVQSDFAVRIF